MLFLTRYPREKIIIGHLVEVMVLDVQGQKVTVGIKAPKAIPINRDEIYWRKVAENPELSIKKMLGSNAFEFAE